MQNSSKIRAFFLNVVLLILSSAILISILEIWLQITSTRKADNFATTKEWHKKFVTRNSHGLRDKEYSYNKPDEIYRILVLGDSQTFGHGIKRLEDTWHKKLEVLLNKGFSNQKFEVIALAGEGWNTVFHRCRFCATSPAIFRAEKILGHASVCLICLGRRVYASKRSVSMDLLQTDGIRRLSRGCWK